MADGFPVLIDGVAVVARAGETVLDVAARAGATIPTLCHDPRLDPTGACRMCLVEIAGQRRLQPACAHQVTPNMAVTTTSPRIETHRSVLLSMYLADHATGADGLPPVTGGALRAQAAACDDLLDLPKVHAPRAGRDADDNPYIGFDPTACILCARCTRYCDEIEGVSAIQLVERGGHTTIGTAGMRGLIDTSCELCGGCIATCPTGALFEKKLPVAPPPVTRVGDDARVRTTCNFCGVGCQMDLRVRDGRVVSVEPPPPGTTVNDGSLCVKGRFAFDFIHHKDRLTTPLVRQEDGTFAAASWPDALRRVARGLTGIRERHGSGALGFVSSSRCTGEENYLLQKLSRAAFGTNNCHQCAAT